MNLGKVVNGLRRNWNRREFWRNNLQKRVLGPTHAHLSRFEGTPFMDEDWDTLLILDACRYDLFEEVSRDMNLSGTLNSKISLGSGSVEFLQKNFAGRQFHDTQYVTANPFAKMHLDESVFYRSDHVWIDGWDEENQTVLAETMAERAYDAYTEHPDKRLIVHFMQPHVPFVGANSFDATGFELARSKALGGDGDAVRDVWTKLREGDVSKDDIWAAYRKNLEYSLPLALDLAYKLDGKTVVTSDHGNAFGELLWPFPMRVYGHPINIRLESLVKVPWFEIPFDERREITTSNPELESCSVTDETVDERLESLGYLD